MHFESPKALYKFPIMMLLMLIIIIIIIIKQAVSQDR